MAPPEASALPAPLRLPAAFPFVGRGRELAALRTLLPLAAGEGRRVALVGGEAGSGKSRLAREFAWAASEAGTLVLYGACDSVVPTPYQPFAEALAQLVRTSDPAVLQAELGSAGGELARLLPDLATRVPGLPAPILADPDTERHRLHTAVTDLLSAVTTRAPVLLVLEDLHWADGPSLLLLRHLVRVAAGARILVLGTFRDTEADMPAELAETLVDLRRAEDVVRLRLAGLNDAEVAEFVHRAAGGDLGSELPEVARTISSLTAGNAFLVCELWRALLETESIEELDGGLRLRRPIAELATPESVRELVSQRLSRLRPATRVLLELAAVAGPELELATLRRAAVLRDGELAEALEEAVRSGMVEELHSRELTYRFTHELVRLALSDRLTGLRRAELHLRVAEALEEGAGPQGQRALAGLAYHFAAAAPLGDVRKAVDYNVLAARRALETLAFDEGVARLRQALELGIDDPGERAAIQLELGTAHHLAGSAGEALAAFRAAFETARELGDAELLARAAIGYEDACWRPGISDAGAIELIRAAAEAVGAAPSSLRTQLESALARALEFCGEHAAAADVWRRAIAMAREGRDRRDLATVLMRSYWGRGTFSDGEILDMLAEASAIAEEIGDIEIRAETMEWRVAALIGSCQLDAARRELREVLDLAHAMRQPFIVHVAEHHASSIALSDGLLEEAEAAARRSHEWGRLLTGRDPSGIYGIQMFSVRREQGRLAELAPVVRVLASAERGGVWGPGYAAILAELGMLEEARRELDRLERDGVHGLRESLWVASLTYLADAVAAVGHASLARLLYPELAPFAGGGIMIAHGVAFYGAADRFLGMLAATVGDTDAAVAHFERAAELNERMGSLTWLAHTEYEHGRALLARGTADDVAAAGEHLARAAALAERIGMLALLARIRALGARPRREPSIPDGLSAREVEILRLLARGLSNREIGRELVISEHTAANHVRSILRKTGCANRTEAASYAHRQGLVRA